MNISAFLSKTKILFPLIIGVNFTHAFAQSETLHTEVSINNEAEINTPFQEYSPAFYKNGLVFIGSNPAVAETKRTDDETGKKATSFFLAMPNELY